MKNTKSLFVLVFILLNIQFGYSQFDDYKTTIGFTCGGTGSSTPLVNKVYDLIINNKQNSIRRLLYSKIPAKNFLGVVICEKFSRENKIKLRVKDLKKISELYKSLNRFEYCGGCTEMGYLVLSECLNRIGTEKIRDEAEQWVDEISKI